MDISKEFLRDEVRSGFYIPTAIKQVWACQLKVLSEIDRICKKYNIMYFAEWGSLLGAVRHGGFIPWDDDLDISMKREDFDKFMEVADKELPEGFAIHNYERQEGHWMFLSRVVNCNHICFDEEHLDKYFNFSYIASVDIFVLDYLYKNKEDERKRCKEIKYLLAVADGISQEILGKNIVEQELKKIEKQYAVKLCDNKKLHGDNWRKSLAVDLYKLAEKQMGRVPKDESDSIGQIFPWILKGGKGLPKIFYGEAVRLPFENGDIPVPAGYHKVLTSRYGDYFKIHKVWGGHDYPYFEKQKDALKAVLDFELPEFRYEEGMFREDAGIEDRSENSIKGIIKTALEELETNVDILRGFAVAGQLNDILSALPEMQQLAIDIGSFVENVKGEEASSTKEIVTCLEEFCETLYVFYGSVEAACGENVVSKNVSGSMNSLLEVYAKIKTAISKWILDRQVVLFVSTGAKEWSAFSDIYSECIKAGNEVQVVITPAFRKNALGQVKLDEEEHALANIIDGYPNEIKIRAWSNYNLELENPDIIYFQNPYDGENPCLTVPPEFYSNNLQKYSKKLVYVPAFKVEEFCEKDTTAVYNMKHYVTAPGLMYADEILVQSENMKQMWLNKLVEFAGENTRMVWENKLAIRQIKGEKQSIENRKKKLLFVIGIDEVTESGEAFIPRVEEKLKLLNSSKDRLEIDICLYPENKDVWEAVAKERYGELMKTLNGWNLVSVTKAGKIYLDEYDAYYGNPSPYAHRMNYDWKPVMIMDIEI